MERLCNVDGTTPTVQSKGYLVGSTCTPMESYTHTETANPGISSSTTPPQTLNFLVLKTRHGIVQDRTTVDGKPVAIVTARTTYGHEIDSVVGFARLADPSYVHDASTFQQAVSAIDYTFNWFYTDNNKTAPGFSAADNQWGYGAIYRSLALDDRVRARIAGGKKVTRPQLVEAMMDGGTVDVRAAYLLPSLLTLLGTPSDPQDARAVALLRAWLDDGAHRVDKARRGSYLHQGAIALFDAWWDPAGAGVTGSRPLAKDVLRGTSEASSMPSRSPWMTTRVRASAPPGTASRGTGTSARTSVRSSANRSSDATAGPTVARASWPPVGPMCWRRCTWQGTPPWPSSRGRTWRRSPTTSRWTSSGPPRPGWSGCAGSTGRTARPSSRS